ncbi:MAG: PRC-barrel domain-containing protein [Idiomarina sp.]|nr:PRC-barrel domain-containing protein [Idiomarina sp.]
MKKLHSLAFYALVTPVLTFGAGSVLAQYSVDQSASSSEVGYQLGQAATKNAATRDQRAQSREQHRGYVDAVPLNGTHASKLIGTKVRTRSNEDIGSVDDLILDEHGKVVAIIVSVGGFLGVGQKDVAIGWGNLTRSGTADKPELRVDVSRADLNSAPEFSKRTQASTAGNPRSTPDQSRNTHRGHIAGVPAHGYHTNSLIGAKVNSRDNENVGSVDDLLIDANGQVVAIMVGVGGFLGMGQKDVAIGWGNVTRTGTADNQEIRADVTRDALRAAPKFGGSK